jgi:outer membrane translocation and assembly module TamA
VTGSHAVEFSAPESTYASVSFGARFTTPRLPYGRFVFDAYYVRRYRNYYNTFFSLDNTTRLRGYTADPEINSDFFGDGVIAHNLEFRTRPLQLFSTLLGAVVFHDVGDAFYELDEIKLKHSVGVGIRFLAPQLDRDVFRIDVGFPLFSDDPQAGTTVNATFGQAFSPP